MNSTFALIKILSPFWSALRHQAVAGVSRATSRRAYERFLKKAPCNSYVMVGKDGWRLFDEPTEKLPRCRLQLNRDWKEPGGHAATASTCDDSEGDHRVYLPSSPLSSAQRAWSNICAPRRVQRMCCFFSIRQSTSWSTVDSTRTVDMRWPSRYSLP
jgi:hypothetical protein